jgi:kynureninase
MTGDPLLAFRGEFPILERTTYLVSNSLGAMPRTVADRLAEYVDEWADHGVRAWARGWWEMPVKAGDIIAPLIGAPEGTVAMVPNVSQAHAEVISALDYSPPRDTIVMTELDFPSSRYVVELLAARLGARVVVVPSDDGMSIDEERLLAAIDERTRLVAVSHVLFRSAFIMDAEAICRDAFHSVGVMPVDVQQAGVDFLAGGVLKWLCGGPGGCFLYASPTVSAAHKPAVTGWQAHRRPFAFEQEMDHSEGAWRWLGGTPSIPALYAATEGPKLVRRAGIERIREKSMKQTARLIELADEAGYAVQAPRDPARRGGTVAIDPPHAYEVAQSLLEKDILVDFRPGAGIRVAPHFYTTDDEIEYAIGTMREVIESGEWQHFEGKRSVVT